MAHGGDGYVDHSDIESSAGSNEGEEVIFNYNARGDGHRPKCGSRRSGSYVKIENFCGEKQDWSTWFKVFSRVAKLNGWGADTVVNQLFAHLRGPALEVACALPDDDIDNYERLVEILEAQFGPAKHSELFLAELRNRVKKPKESYRELGRAITTLCKRAYPTLTYVERERMGRMHFIDAVPESELRLLLLQGRPAGLNEAVQLAEELDGYRKMETQRNQPPSRSSFVRNVTEGDHQMPSDFVTKLETVLDAVIQLLPALSINSEFKNHRRRPTCWVCNEVGHVSRDCPRRKYDDA